MHPVVVVAAEGRLVAAVAAGEPQEVAVGEVEVLGRLLVAPAAVEGGEGV